MRVLVINNINGKEVVYENVKQVYYPNLLEFAIVLEDGTEVKYNDSYFSYHY